MRILSWHNPKQQRRVTPMAWVSRHPQPELGSFFKAANQLKRIPEGDRALFFWGSLRDGLWEERPFVELFADGPDVDSERDWYIDFYRRFSDSGGVADWVVVDYEQSFSTYSPVFSKMSEQEQLAAVRAVFEHPRARHRLGPTFANHFEPDDLFHPEKRGMFVWFWNQAQGRLRGRTRYDVIGETHTALTGRDVPFINYNDTVVGTVAYDPNGVVLATNSSAGFAAPSMYLDNGNRVRARGGKPTWWRSLVHAVNLHRASLLGTSQVPPWIDWPSHNAHVIEVGDPFRRTLWRELQRHARAAGIDTFLYWNPKESAEDVPFAQRVFDEIAEIEPRRAGLEPLDLEADDITTHDVKTRYADLAPLAR